MPSYHVQLCSTSGAHPGMARKVLRAFPAPRRQLRRRCPCLSGRRMEPFVIEKSNLHGIKNWTHAVQRRVSSLMCEGTAKDGASALQSLSRVGARSH